MNGSFINKADHGIKRKTVGEYVKNSINTITIKTMISTKMIIYKRVAATDEYKRLKTKLEE